MSKTSLELGIDEALATVGGFRRWHVTMIILIGMSMFMHICWQGLIFVFISWVPQHRCRASPEHLANNVSTTWTNITVDKCFMTNINSSQPEPCRYGWEYDNEGYHTIIEQWDLVCDRNYLAELSQTLLLAGYLMACTLVSPLVDRFGRKPIFVYSQIFIGVIGIGIAFVESYPLYVVLRIMLGLISLTTCNAGSTYLLELFDTKRRAKAGITVELMWVFSYMTLPLLAYWLKDWRNLQVMISSVSFFWLIFIFILPESPQWLAVMDRKAEAEAILEKMARWNGVTLPEGGIRLLADCQSGNEVPSREVSKSSLSAISNVEYTDVSNESSNDSFDKNTKISVGFGTCIENGSADKAMNGCNDKIVSAEKSSEELEFENIPVSKLFTNGNLRVTLLVCNGIWFANCFIYYGLILSTPSLAGDRFINFALMGVLEIPACLLALYTTDHFGRRLTACIYHIMAGLPLAFLILIPERSSSGLDLSPLILTLVMISKFGISASFSVIVVYTREVFPTPLRSTGNGMGQISGCIGNMVAPFCAYAGKTSLYWLPNILYGGVGVVVGLLTLLLPETSGRAMPQSIAEIDEMFKTRRFNILPKRFMAKISFKDSNDIKADLNTNTKF